MASLSVFPCNFPSLHSHILHDLRCRLQTHSVICYASIRKARATRKLMNDMDLCEGLRQFAASIGLPAGYVPTTKELTEHGRKDLANIVRRRGYKRIKELLNSVDSGAYKNDFKKTSTGKQNGVSDHDDDTVGQDNIAKDLSKELEDVSLTNEVSTIEYNTATNFDQPVTPSDQSHTTIESLVTASLQEKVAKFIKYGELDSVEDNLCSILKLNGIKDDNGYMGNFAETETMGHIEGDSGHMPTDDGDNVVMDRAEMTYRLGPSPALENSQMSDDFLSAERPKDADCDEDIHSEMSSLEYRDEIGHLKFILHQKELELSRLNEQIEKEKQALSILQSEAENEISKAQKLISNKDAELHSAEESLSGLKEIQIQYWGVGEMVEIAGSFNGWHQRIKMNPQPSSTTVDPIGIGSRTSTSWSTTLWLYPGVYEIKFIVDAYIVLSVQETDSVDNGKKNLSNRLLLLGATKLQGLQQKEGRIFRLAPWMPGLALPSPEHLEASFLLPSLSPGHPVQFFSFRCLTSALFCQLCWIGKSGPFLAQNNVPLNRNHCMLFSLYII
ncbi:hypothetical protein Nepgr_011681 [Nepenthes gracilis]|uniref:AMP-activated protein kinase glycogen-binding domain-containing protein n=1 Tax=Nepenthes gracilis TaxID=150966 RepID=A0AAD3XML2_NEPGR|nr:hypothetical protein Nepgr_011681 [Nepenthes gracilis]